MFLKKGRDVLKSFFQEKGQDNRLEKMKKGKNKKKLTAFFKQKSPK